MRRYGGRLILVLLLAGTAIAQPSLNTSEAANLLIKAYREDMSPTGDYQRSLAFRFAAAQSGHREDALGELLSNLKSMPRLLSEFEIGSDLYFPRIDANKTSVLSVREGSSPASEDLSLIDCVALEKSSFCNGPSFGSDTRNSFLRKRVIKGRLIPGQFEWSRTFNWNVLYTSSPSGVITEWQLESPKERSFARRPGFEPISPIPGETRILGRLNGTRAVKFDPATGEVVDIAECEPDNRRHPIRSNRIAAVLACDDRLVVWSHTDQVTHEVSGSFEFRLIEDALILWPKQTEPFSISVFKASTGIKEFETSAKYDYIFDVDSNNAESLWVHGCESIVATPAGNPCLVGLRVLDLWDMSLSTVSTVSRGVEQFATDNNNRAVFVNERKEFLKTEVGVNSRIKVAAGDYLALGSRDGTMAVINSVGSEELVRLYDLSGYSAIQRFTRDQEASVASVAMLANGTIAAGGFDGMISLTRPDSSVMSSSEIEIKVAKNRSSGSISAPIERLFVRENALHVAAGRSYIGSKTVQLDLEPSGLKLMSEFDISAPNLFDLSADGTVAAYVTDGKGSNATELSIVDLKSGQRPVTTSAAACEDAKRPRSRSPLLLQVRISGDGQRVVLLGQTSILVFDKANRRRRCYKLNDEYRVLEYLPGVDRLLLGGENRLMVFDISRGTEVKTLPFNGSSRHSSASNDHEWIAVVSYDETLIFSAANQSIRSTLPFSPRAIAFSPDTSALIMGDDRSVERVSWKIGDIIKALCGELLTPKDNPENTSVLIKNYCDNLDQP